MALDDDVDCDVHADVDDTGDVRQDNDGDVDVDVEANSSSNINDKCNFCLMHCRHSTVVPLGWTGSIVAHSPMRMMMMLMVVMVITDHNGGYDHELDDLDDDDMRTNPNL